LQSFCLNVKQIAAGQHPSEIMTAWHTLSLFFHLVALALWLGGIAFFLVVFAPAVHDLQPGIGIRTLNQGRISLEAVSWAGIALLLVTGIINLVLRYQGPSGSPSHFYSITLAVKLFLFAAMVVHHCLQVFKYGPKIASLTVQLPAVINSWPEPLLTHWRKWFLLLKINAALGPAVMFLGIALLKS
jgi:putative copper export protein